jgi:hypothetical protein
MAHGQLLFGALQTQEAVMYRAGQLAKRNDTGQQVLVVEVIPVGSTVFYRVEHENGDLGLVQATSLRPVVLPLSAEEQRRAA